MRRESTIEPAVKALKTIARRPNLSNPESVRVYLASTQLSEARKSKLADDLIRFYRYKRIPFEKPRYKVVEQIPFIRLETEIDQLISALGPKTKIWPSNCMMCRMSSWLVDTPLLPSNVVECRK
jgi:hypothetical protein